jgi:hypothetical protein
MFRIRQHCDGCLTCVLTWILTKRDRQIHQPRIRSGYEYVIVGKWRHNPILGILQRLPFSIDYHYPATTILQRLPFSSSSHSPAPPILQRTPFLQRLPFSSDCRSPAPTILRRLPLQRLQHYPVQLLCALSFSKYFLSCLFTNPFSGHYISLAFLVTTRRSMVTTSRNSQSGSQWL